MPNVKEPPFSSFGRTIRATFSEREMPSGRDGRITRFSELERISRRTMGTRVHLSIFNLSRDIVLQQITFDISSSMRRARLTVRKLFKIMHHAAIQLNEVL